MRPTKAVVLFNGTSAVNTAIDTGVLDVSDFDTLGFHFVLTGGVAPAGLLSSYTGYAADGTTVVLQAGATIATGAANGNGGAGPGCTGTQNGMVAFAGSLPPKVKVALPAFGVGISARLVVHGRRNFKELAGPLDPTTGVPTEV